MKSPDQDLYDTFWRLAVGTGLPVYDALPGKTAAYPFVVMGETQTVEDPTKTRRLATVILELDVWGSQKQRLEVSRAVSNLATLAQNMRNIQFYNVKLLEQPTSSQVLQDNSTGSNLWRGIYVPQFKLI